MKSSSKFWISNLAFIIAFVIGILFFIQRNNSEDLLIRAKSNNSEVSHDKDIDYSESASQETLVTSKQNKNIEKDSGKVLQKYPIYLTGEVKNPGIYHVEENTYIYEVIEMAGGFTEKAAKSYINLAAKVNLESHIYVPNINDNEIEVLHKFSNFSNSDLENNTSIKNLVNINIANIEELKTLPGIGQSMAERIIDYHQELLFQSSYLC